MAEPIIISSSQLATYIECKKRYQLAYEMGLEPLQNSAPMEKGTAFHKWAEYQTTINHPNLPQNRLWDHTLDTPKDLEARGLYEDWWTHKGLAKEGKKKRVLGVEAPIYTPLTINTGVPYQQVYLRCTFDEIYLDTNDWIVGKDYKTFKTKTDWDTELDFQGRIYLGALGLLFPDRNVRFEYERIRQSRPGTPRGDSSNLRLIDGTWWMYNPAGTKRKRADLWTPEDCYDTIDLVCTPYEIAELWEETLFNVTELIVRQRLSASGSKGAWTHAANKFTCQGCYMKDLCKADLNGSLDEDTIRLMATKRAPMEIPEFMKEKVEA